jgi:hypothetical protein
LRARRLRTLADAARLCSTACVGDRARIPTDGEGVVVVSSELGLGMVLCRVRGARGVERACSGLQDSPVPGRWGFVLDRARGHGQLSDSGVWMVCVVRGGGAGADRLCAERTKMREGTDRGERCHCLKKSFVDRWKPIPVLRVLLRVEMPLGIDQTAQRGRRSLARLWERSDWTGLPPRADQRQTCSNVVPVYLAGGQGRRARQDERRRRS